jgi:hypothetical protein
LAPIPQAECKIRVRVEKPISQLIVGRWRVVVMPATSTAFVGTVALGGPPVPVFQLLHHPGREFVQHRSAGGRVVRFHVVQRVFHVNHPRTGFFVTARVDSAFHDPFGPRPG